MKLNKKALRLERLSFLFETSLLFFHNVLFLVLKLNKTYLAFCILLISCGPVYNLKQAKKHLLKAEAKGAKVDRDTVFKFVFVPDRVTDTIVRFKEVKRIFTDTLKVETTRWRTWTKFDTVTKKIFQRVECKADTIRVPVEVKTTISAGFSGWNLFGMVIFGLVVGALVGKILWK